MGRPSCREDETGREKNDMRVEESVETDRLVEEVFSYATDPEHFPEWAGIIEVRKEGTGELAAGDRFTTVNKFLGRRWETPLEVTAHEQNRLHSHRSTGGLFRRNYDHLRGNGGERHTHDAGAGRRAGRLLQVGGAALGEGRQTTVAGRPGRRSRTFWKRRARHDGAG